MTPQKVKLAPMNPTATDQPQCSSAGPATQRMASMPTQSATRLKTNRITRRNRSSFVNPTASQFHRLRIHTWPAPRAAQYPSTITKTTSRQAPARTTPPRVAHHYRVSGLVQRGSKRTPEREARREPQAQLVAVRLTVGLGRWWKVIIRFWEVAPDPCNIIFDLEVEANFCKHARKLVRVVNSF